MPTLAHTDFGRVYSRTRTDKLWVRFLGPDGKEIRRSAGTTDLKEATAFLETQSCRLRELSFEGAVVDFFEVKNRTLKPKSLECYRSNLRSVHPFCGTLLLSEITQRWIKNFISIRRKEVTDTTVKRELAFISSVISHAMQTLEGAPAFNPIVAMPLSMLKEKSRDRWLTVAEYDTLIGSCWGEMHKAIIHLAAHTGMRTSELMALRKPMIDFPARQVVLPGKYTKNKKPRVVPLSEFAFRTLKQVCETAPDDLVLWHPSQDNSKAEAYTSFTRFFRTARRRAGLEDFRFHDLRHTFASWWVQKGGDVSALKTILGHSSYQMVARYAYLDTAAAHRAMLEIYPHTFNTLPEIDPHTRAQPFETKPKQPS